MSDEKTRVTVSVTAYKEFLRIARPGLYALYSACWRNGYTVNGIRP